MGDKTGIEWTDATWNPLIGCSMVSAGCENCYAMKVAHRFQGTHKHYAGTTVLGKHGPRWTGLVNQAPLKILDQPLRWTRPRFVFVNSMSDLFHESVPFEFIAAVFGVMAASPWHVYQVLTKRPERAVEFFKWIGSRTVGPIPTVAYCMGTHGILPKGKKGFTFEGVSWPLDNVWIGTSIEDQKSADERLPILFQIPTVVRWISAEPLLGLTDLGLMGTLPGDKFPGYQMSYDKLDWVVVGGESGPGARPMAASWAESILDQCKRAEVPVMMKQWGDWAPFSGSIRIDEHSGVDLPLRGEPLQVIDIKTATGKRKFQWAGVGWMERVGKKVAGRELRGQHWDEYPKKRFAKSSAAA